jgi:hypothetical protein
MLRSKPGSKEAGSRYPGSLTSGVRMDKNVWCAGLLQYISNASCLLRHGVCHFLDWI